MKRYLYYNQDSVNSLLAQIEQGLLIKDNTGSEETKTKSTTNSIKPDITGDINAKVLGVGASIKGTIEGENSDTRATSKLIENIQEKILHDYAFDRIFQYINENDLIHNDDPQIGDIVSITDSPTFLDFDYFQALFSADGAMMLVAEEQKLEMTNKISELRKSVPNKGKLPPEIKTQLDTLQKQVNNSDSEIKRIGKMICAIRSVLPYNRFVMTKDMLIPLDDDKIRDNPEIVAFKYGGQMTVFGYVTNIVTSDESANKSNEFASIYDGINKAMLGMFKGQKKIFIIHPITIFY